MSRQISVATQSRTPLFNILLLIAGYGGGQGSIFLAQTWLVTQGRLELLALFGTHFSFAMLGIIFVEAGSLAILARHAARISHAGKPMALAWRVFWETSIFRAALALLLIAAVALWVLRSEDGFFRSYAMYSAPAYLVWSVNAAGFLDGVKLSGISGLTGSVAYVSSAVALLLAADASASDAGIILGAAFSIGHALTVCMQAAALHRAGWKPIFSRPTRGGILQAGRDGLAMLGAALPGQIYFRAQLLISSAWLGTEATAVFVYVKQVVTAVIRLVGLLWRAEFPNLVTRLSEITAGQIAVIIRRQWNGLVIAIVAALAVCGAGLAMSGQPGALFIDIGHMLSLFSAVIVLSAFCLALTQGLAALGRYGALRTVSLISTAAGLLASLLLARPMGLAGLAIADAVAAIAAISVALHFARQRRCP